MPTLAPPTLRLEDLDRDELLELVRDRGLHIRPYDLLRARWKISNVRHRAAMDVAAAAWNAWSETVQARLTPGIPSVEYRRLNAETAIRERARDLADRVESKAKAKSDEAWALLEAAR